MDELTWDFGLVVPSGWYVYDPDPDTRSSSTSAAVDQRIRENPKLGPARNSLVEVLLGFWADADEAGALAAAVLWEPANPAAVAANLTVEAYSDAPGTLEEFRAGALGATELDIRERTVTVIELRAGSAVRVRALRRSGVADSDGSDLAIDVVEHWVPVPGHTDVLVLRGSTPCLDVADEIADLFDQIAGTLRFTIVPAQAGIEAPKGL